MSAAPTLPYGKAHVTDWWQDRDGRIYRGDGPYQNRPLRVFRRKAAVRRARWRR